MPQQVIINTQALPIYPVACDVRHENKALECRLDFTKSQTYILTSNTPQTQAAFRNLRSIYIDNAQNPEPVQVLTDTGFSCLAPALSQGNYEVVAGSPSFTVTFYSTGNCAVSAWLYNYTVNPAVWDVIGQGTGGDGVGGASCGFFSVKTFGATGDGSTDDTEAIQNTINAAVVTGNGVCCPPGVYVISQPLVITLTGPLQFVGAGYDPVSQKGTVITNKGAGDAFAINISGAASTDTEITFRDFRLDGWSGSAYGFNVYQAHGVRIDNVWTTGHGQSGVKLNFVYRFLALHCCFTHNTYYGCEIRKSNHITLVECTIGNNGKLTGNANVFVASCNHVNLYSCDISGAGQDTGVSSDGIYAGSIDQINVRDCWIEANNGNAITFTTLVKGFLIEGCAISDGIVQIVGGADSGVVGVNTWFPNTAGKTTGWYVAGTANPSNIVFHPQFVEAGPGTVQQVYGPSTVLTGGKVGIATAPTAALTLNAGALSNPVQPLPAHSSIWSSGFGASPSDTALTNRFSLGVDYNQDYGAYFASAYLADNTPAAVIGSRNAGNDYPAIYCKSGNVGIQTPNPYGTLTVLDGSNSVPSLSKHAPALAVFGCVGWPTLSIFNQNTAPYTMSVQTRNDGIDGLSYPIALNPLGGPVGIGTINPGVKLHVQQGSDVNTQGIGVSNAAITRSGFLWMDTGNVLHLDCAAGGAGQITLNSGGGGVNVGGSPSSPNVPLEVRGAGALVGQAAQLRLTDSAGSGMVLHMGASVDATTNHIAWLQATELGVSNNRALVLQNAGGNVGIGKTTPGSKLAVAGLPTYASDAAAGTGGLTTGDFYVDAAGGVHMKL